MNKDFAVDYLASNGLDEVEPEKLEKLATGVDGHPLALKLLVELVKVFGAADVIQDLSLYRKDKEETILKARKLFDKLAGNEKELLERISIYRGHVGLEGLKEMFTEHTPKNAVKKLIDKSLLETDHNGTYWLHPLVQEFSYEDLKNKKEAHMIAVKYYLSIPLPENPTKKEDLQPSIEAHYHACEAEEYDLAAKIILHSNLHVYLDIWGDYTTLITLYRQLLPSDPLNDEFLLSKEMKSFVFGDLGLTFMQLGYVRKAIEYYEQALKISREIGDRRGEGADLGNLGLAYSDLGEPRKAIEYYEQALKISREIGDRRGEGADLGNLGSAYSHLGEPRKAIEYYEQALKISREIGDRRNEGTWLGNLGLAYSHLGEPRKAIEYYEQALKISREIGDRRNEGTWLGNLGLVYSGLGESRKAIELLKQSLSIGKEIEDPRIINFCENKLKELDEIEDSENSDYYPTSNNPPASKNLYQTIVSKLKPKK
ncbi:tetratricopeptide repeat protein [Methanosarcina sp.]|uniref:tetratricopeptide repeat protein n=1 Tax=Methanosarcina sp. TaxID=2213 RepID=UPI00298810AA|nr:tetratricopeptide repeat protein [Methanosarcina sp.]MDW5550956.1 tetratricopeptide repeat protein [Methanosarcina sp.]MDW5556010.1 tetratricopeptide repeat protein [Methanosarcina sp.]MDW5561533.1 tetratricopeptide repeat protein [Methanosarcina sp.]